jgi:hypothetical protein
MASFRTEINLDPSAARIDLHSRIVTEGSCFADAIGSRLQSFKVRTIVNPFGVIYNPESIHKALDQAVFNESPPEHTFLRNQEIFLSYNFHSQFSALRREDLVSTMLNAIGATHYFLKDADWLLLTYGTAWVYTRNDTGEVVANCHKMPQSLFTKALLTPEQVVASFRSFHAHLRQINPRIRVILTVSPVRHIKDTLVFNNVSKSALVLACHMICQEFADVEYFPAYEMMMDDLRDYRFYQRDRIHPTTEAEDYIWEKFMERYFTPEAKDFAKTWNGIRAALLHKPFHPESESHQRFLRDLLTRLVELKPAVDVEEEIFEVKRQMKSSDHD